VNLLWNYNRATWYGLTLLTLLLIGRLQNSPIIVWAHIELKLVLATAHTV
jgi:hypothetical protein